MAFTCALVLASLVASALNAWRRAGVMVGYTESPSWWIKMEVENMVNEVGSGPKCKAE
jgi:hypothetical protein